MIVSQSVNPNAPARSFLASPAVKHAVVEIASFVHDVHKAYILELAEAYMSFLGGVPCGGELTVRYPIPQSRQLCPRVPDVHYRHGGCP